MRLKEIEARLAEIREELNTRAAELTDEEMTALEAEVTALQEERTSLQAAAEKTQKFTCKNCCGRAYRRSRHRTYDIQKLCRSRRNGCSNNRARG